MTEQNIEKRAEELLGFRVVKEGSMSPTEHWIYIKGFPFFATDIHISAWQTTLSLLTSLSLCEKTLGEYADEGNWKKIYTQSTHALKWDKQQHGYEPAKKTLEEIKGK